MEHPLDQFLYCPKCGSSHFEINNEKSKKCADCGFVYYFNPSAATVALILNEKNELLVCRRAKEPAKGTLDLPGGFIDMNETGEEGVAREVLEETGLKVKKAIYQFSLPNIYVYSGFPVHVAEYTAIRRKPDLYKYTIQLNQTFFFRFTIFDAQGSQFITISYHFRSL